MRIHSPQITGSAENTNIVTITRITSLSALSASFASTASFVQNAQSASYVLNAVSASRAVSSSRADSATTSSYVLNAVSSSYAATASYADNFTVGGTLTAQTINVQIITSSIEFNTGSTRNGALSTNTHQFTGSVLMSGSLGIGTSSPLAPLYILAPTTIVDSNGQLFVGASDVLGADKGGQIMLGGKYTSTVNTAFGGIAAKKDNATDGNFGGYLQFFSSTHGVGNTEKMRITSAGNVGIGNTSPEYKVDLCPYNAELPQDVIRLGVYNGPNGGGGSTLGTGIIWKPYYSGYTRRSAGIVQIAENNYFRAALAFYTNNNADQTTDWSERMRITSGGVVQISNAGDAQLSLSAAGATAYVRYSNSSGDIWGLGNGFASSTDFELYNFTTSTYTFRIKRAGIYATTATSPRSVFVQSDGTLGGISSVRESKTNITSLDSNWLMQLNPVSFNYRKKDTEDKYTNEHYDELFYGLIAEEVESVNKEICTYNDDKLIGIEYTKIIPVLVKAIQELKSENDTLKEILQRNNIQ